MTKIVSMRCNKEHKYNLDHQSQTWQHLFTNARDLWDPVIDMFSQSSIISSSDVADIVMYTYAGEHMTVTRACPVLWRSLVVYLQQLPSDVTESA